MFDLVTEYFSGILLKQNSMKFQKTDNTLFAKLNDQLTYVSLSK